MFENTIDDKISVILQKNNENTLDIIIHPNNNILIDISDRKEIFILNEAITNDINKNIKGTNVYVIKNNYLIDLAIKGAIENGTNTNICLLYIKKNGKETCILKNNVKCIFKR